MSPEETEATPASSTGAETGGATSLPRRDLLSIWTVIEKLVVSADRIAGAYEYGQEDGDAVDEETRQEHNQCLADYLDEIAPELIEARNLLLEHIDLTADEAEHLTRNVIQYWSQARPSFDYEGDDLHQPDIRV